MTQNETHDNGMKVRREVLGDAYVDAALEKTTPLTADFQDFITRYAWGEVWTRPALDRKTRSCITLTPSWPAATTKSSPRTWRAPSATA
jgi:hypothetical protein